MFRYQSNKQSFVVAALAILLCLTCLAGATLALFTSDPEDGTIGVVTTTGSVKVDIIDDNGETLVGKTLQFYTTAQAEDVLFEPGATFRTQGFRVENKGSIPISFRVSVNTERGPDVADEDYVPMTLEEFNESFDVFLISQEQLEAPDTWEYIKNFTNKGDPLLGGKTSDVYYLVVKMKENATDKFQGRSYSGIGITVTATQGNADIEE